MSEKKGRERPAGGPESQRAVEAEEGPESDAGLTLSKGEQLPFPEGVAVKPWRKKTPERLQGFSLSSWKEAMASPQRGDPGAGGRGQVAREGGPAASDTPTARCLQPSYWSPAVAAAHGHKPGGLKQQKFLPSCSGDRKSNIQQGHTPQGTWGGGHSCSWFLPACPGWCWSHPRLCVCGLTAYAPLCACVCLVGTLSLGLGPSRDGPRGAPQLKGPLTSTKTFFPNEVTVPASGEQDVDVSLGSYLPAHSVSPVVGGLSEGRSQRDRAAFST